MPWYGFLIFGLALVATTAIVVYLLVRRVRIDIDRVALSASREAKTQAFLEVERKRRTRLEAVATELETRLRANRSWFENYVEEIDENIEAEFRDLTSDDDVLLGRLAELLRGPEPREQLSDDLEAGGKIDDETPEGVGGEGREAEEGSAGADEGDPDDPRHPRAPDNGERPTNPNGGGVGSAGG